MVIHEPVQAAIWHALNHYAYSDAIFLAERLYAEVGSDEALFLLATCYYRSGKPIRAYSFLKGKGCPTPQCKYLMAKCCLDINKLSEAESVIVGNVFVKSHTQDDIINEFGEMSSYILSLLGDIYRRTDRFPKAAEHYKRSLKLNPFHWSSFESLCQIGEKPDPTKVFHVGSNESISVCQSNHPGMEVNNFSISTSHQQNVNVLSGVIPTDGQVDVTPITHLTPVAVVQTPNNAVSAPVTLNVESSPALFQTPDLQQACNTQLNMITLAPSRTKRMIPRLGARSALGGAASLSPLTPSFGVLPLPMDTPSPGDTYISIPSFITPSTPAGLIDPDPKAPMKKKLENSGMGSHGISKVTWSTVKEKVPMTRRSQQISAKPVFSQSGNTNTRDVSTPSQQPSLQSNVPVVRRSSRLYSSANSVKENNKSQSTKTRFASPRVPSKKSKSKLSKSQQELNEINKLEATPDTKPATIASAHAQMAQMQKQSAVGLMSLLRDIGKAYLALAQYDCKKAVQLLSELPPQHYNTGWVLCQIGRAFFEVAEYKKAEKLFAEVRHIEPYHFDGMEIYSTTLWQLEKEMELSALAQELVDFDKESPEAWCATGNCFSLQKEHDTAIKFFHRAIQVDPHFAYAYNLLGHEYVLTEELDKALSCFRNAIRVDPRRYNAWYGLGMIYYKQEKFALAEMHFRKALSINPQSSVLLCHIGVVQHALQKSDGALATLNKAVALDPKNPLCKFHRASILFASDKHKDALKELEELKVIVPKESLVYFLIGKVHKKLGNMHLAMMNFSWAMDLDPKGANNQIKEAIDKRYVTDDDDAYDVFGPGDDLEGIDIQEIDSPGDGESSHNTSLMDSDDVQLRALESDESL